MADFHAERDAVATLALAPPAAAVGRRADGTASVTSPTSSRHRRRPSRSTPVCTFSRPASPRCCRSAATTSGRPSRKLARERWLAGFPIPQGSLLARDRHRQGPGRRRHGSWRPARPLSAPVATICRRGPARTSAGPLRRTGGLCEPCGPVAAQETAHEAAARLSGGGKEPPPSPLPVPPVVPLPPPVVVPPEVGPAVLLGAWPAGEDCRGGAWPVVPWVWLGVPPVAVPLSRVAPGVVAASSEGWPRRWWRPGWVRRRPPETSSTSGCRAPAGAGCPAVRCAGPRRGRGRPRGRRPGPRRRAASRRGG